MGTIKSNPPVSIYSLLLFLSGFVVGFIFSILSVNNNVLHSYSKATAYLPEYLIREACIISSGDPYSNIVDPTSHEEVANIDKQLLKDGYKYTNFSSDKAFHDDDDSVALALKQKVKILVFVMTYPKNLNNRAARVRDTWGQRVNKLLFASDSYDPDFPTINISVEEGRSHLTSKSMKSFDHIYKHYGKDYDWYMKADDDTYVIVENLRYFLRDKNPNFPVFYGHWFKAWVKQGYYSGGGGYVLSREALRRFGERQSGVCKGDGGSEDVAIGKCMELLNITTNSSLDSLGKSRFHALSARSMLHGSFPGWYRRYDKYGAIHKGANQLSDYAISFHYCDMACLDDMEYYVYHLRPYGIQSGLQRI